jgi:BirA family biotin operon repressor/biotin-[acetyl-CoA-carboxylase] ligase
LLAGRLGRPYLYAEETPSTQALLDVSLPEGAVAVAERQTAGRGRRGNRWEAPAGAAILCSVLLRPPPGRRIPELSLVAATATADAVERALGLAVQVKWPNDVMVDRRKVAGILGEARADVVVLGIGLNVNQTRDELPPGARVPPASLRTIDGEERDRAPVLASLLVALERRYGEWVDGGLDALYGSLGARDFLRGRRVAVDGVAGTAVAIDRLGRLEVQTDTGERRLVESGEVTYER